MTKSITGIYLTDVVNGTTIQLSIEDCPERTRCHWIWNLDDKAIDWLIGSLAETIKEVLEIVGQPTLGENLILDANRKSTLARSTKDFFAELMCMTIKHWGNEYGIVE